MEKKVLTYEELALYTTIYDGANCRVCRHDNTAMKLYKPVRVSHYMKKIILFGALLIHMSQVLSYGNI